MIAAEVLYDPAADQVVIRVSADGSDGDVELARIDIAGLDQTDLNRLAHVRDPDRPLPAPGADPVTRREP